MSEPVISVVVSTRDRPARLAGLLRALSAQTLEPQAFEVIVVDNGTGAAPVAVPAGEAMRVRVVRPARPGGPASGRNLGWRAAAAGLIAFTDDDCEPEPAWLAALLEAARRAPGAIIQGVTRPIARELDRDGLLAHTVRIERLGPQYETCNIAYPRAILAELGGFDESFGREPAGEDTDLAWRALHAGHRAVFAPAALVRHAVTRQSPAQALRRAYRWSAVVGVYARHPEARVMLWRGRFWNVWHYLLWRSVLVLPAPRWLRAAVLTRHAAALAGRARAAGVRPAAVPLAVAFLAVHDAVECAAILRGALRSRTLVL
ncbi:MAG TPA: glycosyltransferase [Solirubrobacteraceae bacterium]|nr:glycosyltransferase [Solirubrobacteraceae bacterium]